MCNYYNHKTDSGFLLFYGDKKIGTFVDCTDMIRAKHEHQIFLLSQKEGRRAAYVGGNGAAMGGAE